MGETDLSPCVCVDVCLVFVCGNLFRWCLGRLSHLVRSDYSTKEETVIETRKRKWRFFVLSQCYGKESFLKVSRSSQWCVSHAVKSIYRIGS